MILIIISVMNMRGGCGKTTLATALGAMLPHSLVIDLDMQCNASLRMRASCDTVYNINSVLKGKCDIRSAIQHTLLGDCVSGSLNLAWITDLNIDILAKNLKELNEDYQYSIIDTSPSFGALNLSCLVASNYVVVPVTVDKDSISGLKLFYKMFSYMKEQYNFSAKIAGIVVNEYATRQRYNSELCKELLKTAEELGLHVCETAIRKAVAVQHARTREETIFTYQPNAPVVNDFVDVIRELEVIFNA